MGDRQLIVYVPGITMSTKQWSPLTDKLKKEAELSDAEWLGWDHGCGLFSTANTLKKASDLNAAIDAKWRQEQGFSEVILVGHSFGGFLVRVAYLLASGCYNNEPPSPWAASVKRFVLLAALNRGLDQTHIAVRFYDVITRILGRVVFRRFLGQDFISGSEFITDIRLRWIGHMRSLEETKRPSVCQILGTKDSMVKRTDSIDLEQFPNAVHISVDGADHRVLPLIQEGPNRDYRFKIIKDSILGKEVSTKDNPLQSVKFNNIVFILHGIRAANRGWVQDLASKIRTLIPNSQIVTPSYGYLSALEFAIPFLHRRPIREFQHLYSNYYIQNPDAKFHFIGHSNGTYILGWSLETIPAMHFDHVALAGSVLPRNFPWEKKMKGIAPQVGALRNDCSNHDCPVGLLCSGLNGLWRHDIGTGGYDGFNYQDNKVVQYYFHKGGHSAALKDENLKNIAEFIAKPESTKRLELVLEDKRFSLLSRMSPWFFRAIIIVAIYFIACGVMNHDYRLLSGVVASMLLAALTLKTL